MKIQLVLLFSFTRIHSSRGQDSNRSIFGL